MNDVIPITTTFGIYRVPEQIGGEAYYRGGSRAPSNGIIWA